MLSNRFRFGTGQRYGMFRILKRGQLEVWRDMCTVGGPSSSLFSVFSNKLFGFVASIPFVAGVAALCEKNLEFCPSDFFRT